VRDAAAKPTTKLKTGPAPTFDIDLANEMRPCVGRGKAFEEWATQATTLKVLRPRLARGADIFKACEHKFFLALGEDRLVRDPPAFLGG
jgi:hypothetical protein